MNAAPLFPTLPAPWPTLTVCAPTWPPIKADSAAKCKTCTGYWGDLKGERKGPCLTHKRDVPVGSVCKDFYARDYS